MTPVIALKERIMKQGLIIGAAVIATLLGTPVLAQGWPTKPIRVIAPFGSGGSADITGRVFAAYLESQIKQSAVIENRPGANGIIGTEIVKNAPPDGYTIQIVSNSTHGANASLFKKLPYDSIRDFEHVGLFGTFGSVAVVPPDSPIKTLADLTTFAKANPGKTFYGHFNSASHVGGALFALRSGRLWKVSPIRRLAMRLPISMANRSA